MIYLDHAATTRVSPGAAEAMLQALTEGWGNPSARYPFARAAEQRLKSDRELIAGALGCAPEELHFTSGGTEADNWALFAGARANVRAGRHIIVTAVEHSAVLEAARDLEKQGWELTLLPPERDGSLKIETLAAALREDTALVSMMLVNNETGAIFPVGEAAALLKTRGSRAWLHCDAVQGFLKLPFTARDLGADLISLSGHKIGGPKGIGALYVKKGLRLPPMIHGGGQEAGLRSGTEATAQIAGFAAACRERQGSFDTDRAHMEALGAFLRRRLADLIPEVRFLPAGAPHIVSLSLPGYRSEVLVRVLGDRGICVSAGSACHKGKLSHVLAAMKLPPKQAEGTLRVSFGPENTREELEQFCQTLAEVKGSLFPSL